MKVDTSRRGFLKLAGVSVVAGAGLTTHGRAVGTLPPRDAMAAASLGDNRILIEFDSQTRSRIWHLPAGANQGPKVALTQWATTESLTLADGTRIDQFALRDQTKQDVDGPLGRGTRLQIIGLADSQVEKTTAIELLESYPGLALYRVSYRNLSPHPISVRSWTNSELHLPPVDARAAVGDPSDPPFWSFCGSTHSDRRDWVQPVKPGFEQQNFMGMSASDYGGGTPIVDVWRRDIGIAIGHLELTPRPVSLPVSCHDTGVDLAIVFPLERTLQPGEKFDTHETFVALHTGDYFTVLNSYRRIMGTRGLASPQPPQSAYEAIWCAWGYERDCTLQLIEDTLPKVKELGLRWAVIDDGWQAAVGDWKTNPLKYPRGDTDMKQLVQNIRSQGLKPRLWFAPLAAAPGSDLLHDHTDMLLLDKDGAVQNVSWWNSFYLCPAYEKTVTTTLDLVRKFIGEWGYAGLKIDGQHLNAVPPCYNPAHRHARPEESTEKLQDFFQAIYQTAMQLNPEAVVELCPCGTSYSFFNFCSFNQAPASDPESSWQVRHKGKTLKALMGPSAAFAGDHVELSQGGSDFASTVGIGGIVSTKFTWPHDPKPKDSFLLTPEKEAIWRKWIALYNERQLPLGTYRGELYDIGFDKPETHVIEKSGRFYYAFYAREFTGPVRLRGLAAGRYRVRDYFHGRELGKVSSEQGRLQIAFQNFLVLEAIPILEARAI
ncbi:MAG: alpha-galactosidase [Gammaproteobacteria bacterium]|nr:alpha-galactosidase [Gammaproteobacteria bacterium]